MLARLHRRRRNATPELQITAFMNLMVVLVPFLLITAVFSQMAVLEIALPRPSEPTDAAPPPPGLRIEIRSDRAIVLDGGGPIQEIARTDNGAIDSQAINTLLQEIKARQPARESITLLLEPDMPYEDLVKVMDAARIRSGTDEALFPDISIGEIPKADDV